MIEFQQKYIEDAGELITMLEAQLITFENDTSNAEIIQELFRVMHTLKGTSGMFGFRKIEEFTHLLEDIYDLVRANKLEVNNEILNLTFASVDIIRNLLYSKEILDDEQEQTYTDTMALAAKYAKTESLASRRLVEKQPPPKSSTSFYRVVFKPHHQVLLRGIKPDFTIEDLAGLGKHLKFQFTDTTIEMVNDKTFNQYWEVFVDGAVAQGDIADVFMFFTEDEFSVEAAGHSDEAIDAILANTYCAKNNVALPDLKSQLMTLFGWNDKKAEESINEPAPKKNEVAEKAAKHVAATANDDTIRVSATKLDNLLNLLSELIIVNAQCESHAGRLDDERLHNTVKELTKISRNFRDEILTTRLIPIAVLTTSMQRLVRDLSQKLGKEVELVTDGLQTELDKNIINKIENPLMHIIRNCMDHGLETPEERLANDKPARGVVRFFAYYSGASVFIQIQDDGRGIDPKKVFDKAVSKGIVKFDASLSTSQIYDLLFIPGFSTASEVSEVSGRGVGLDVVKNVITELHGEINVDSEVGLGTSFTFKLPLTLSIVDALLVHCGSYKILIPTNNIHICKYIPSDFFKNAELQYQQDNKCVPVKRLGSIFDTKHQSGEFEVLIVVSIYEKLYGLLVDKITTSIQAVIKPLGQMHKNQPYFIGASQLGDGSMAYILDTNFLLKTQ